MTSPNYTAWEISEADFPSNSSIEDQIRFLTGYGILAPSTHNTQPWKFEIAGNELLITADPTVSLPEADPQGRNLQISLGCCVANMTEAASYFGLSVKHHWSMAEIKLVFTPASKHSSAKTFKAITDRYSDKMPYKLVGLQKSHKDGLLKVETPTDTSLTLVTDKTKIDQIATLQKGAVMSYASRRKFFVELSQWLRPSKTDSEDGMPGFVVGLSNPQSKIIRLLVRKFKPTAKVLAKKDNQSVSSSSAVAFISSQNDEPQTWFNTGICYEKLALQATASGLVMAPMAAIIESPKYRSRAMKELDLPGSPQVFFRLGYSKHRPYHTPRKKVDSQHMKTQQQLAKIIGVPLENKQLRIDSYDISYVVAGSGQPLLLLHGANIGWAQWYQNIAQLAKEFKVYALDLPGAGSSTKVDFHKTDFEKDYVRVVDKFIKLNKLNKLHILGSSFGGWIALRLAIEKRPYIDKIVLANPLGFTTHMPPQFRPVSIRPLALFLSKTVLKPDRKNKKLEKFMRDVFYDKQQPLAPEFIEYFYELSKTSHNILFINRLASLKGMRQELFLKSELPKISNPTLVIWGKKDPLMPFATVEDQIKLIPNVKLEVLEEIGHMPPVEAASKVNDLVIKFLKG